MTYFDKVFDRIQHATNKRTQVALAELLEIRQSSISDAKRRDSVPADWFMKLFEKFGLNPDWLKKGTGPMYLRTEQGYTLSDALDGAMYEDAAAYGANSASSVIVPVYSSHPPVGDSEGLKHLGQLHIPTEYAFEGLLVINLDSAANEPFIRRGAYIGIDSTVKQPVSGEFFGLLLPYEGLVIKKVFVDAQAGKLILRSENQEHPETSLPLEDCQKYIAGRVAWTLQKF